MTFQERLTLKNLDKKQLRKVNNTIVAIKKATPEYAIHKQIATYLRYALTHVSYFSSIEISNKQGGREGYIKQSQDKAKGVKTGFPDIIIIHNGQFYALEVKRFSKDATDIQKEEHEKIRKAGGIVEVVHDVDEVRAFIKKYNIPSREANLF